MTINLKYVESYLFAANIDRLCIFLKCRPPPLHPCPYLYAEVNVNLNMIVNVTIIF